METKLSKEELQEQLNIIEEKEKELKEEIFYQDYSDLTFFQLWKNHNDWKRIIIFDIIYSIIIAALCYHTILLPVIFIPTAILFLASLSTALDVKMKINSIKKKRTN